MKNDFIQTIIQQAQPHWHHYVEHDFVQQLGQGTLPLLSFQYYLKQDYLYLFHYNRALALAIFKAENFEQMRDIHQAMTVLLQEIQLHIDFCQDWGISQQDLLNIEEDPACVAYTRYVLDCGITGGLAELYAAIAPCAIGYAEIGLRLSQQNLVSNNPYQKWIDSYADETFQTAVEKYKDFLTALCQDLNAKQLANIQHIFTTATRMEVAFWQMGLDH
ncbi:thiaminase II [Lonepinella sp. MS14436]|uniref:thiaminase II n=1 Tax=Lonepinella sp. MS14436 TaxID=3003619 RepID=UPI0036DEEB97